MRRVDSSDGDTVAVLSMMSLRSQSRRDAASPAVKRVSESESWESRWRRACRLQSESLACSGWDSDRAVMAARSSPDATKRSTTRCSVSRSEWSTDE
eukprot:2883530-Rhodomonas_salina.3